MKKITYSLSAALLALTIIPWQASTASAEEAVAPVTPFTTEITVQTEANFTNAATVDTFIKQAVRNHVSVINMTVKQDSDVNGSSGYAFYNSELVKEATGFTEFDALADVIEEAHQYGIKVNAVVPQFQDKAAIDKNSSWQMRTINDKGRFSAYTGMNGSTYYVNPFEADVQTYERSIIKEVVTNYNVDGVVLSGLDFDTDRVDMNTSTRSAFQSANGFDPDTIDFTKSNSNKLNTWNTWKAEQLAAYVQNVNEDIATIKPDLALGVFTVSPTLTGTSQDISLLKDNVDFILPIADFQTLGYSADWVYSNNGILKATEAKLATTVPNAKTTTEEKTAITVIPSLNIELNTADVQNIYNGMRTNTPTVTSVNYAVKGQWTDAMFNNVGVRNSF